MSDTFETFVQWYVRYGYLVLFFGVFLENMGVPVPGETAVLIAGFLASAAGGAHLHLGWVIPLAFGAAACGDNLGFGIGRLLRSRLRSGRRFLFLTPERMQTAEGYFQRYGAWMVFLARFITGVRVVAAPAAGAAGMPWPLYLVAEAAGAVTWATLISLLGYFFGKSWKVLEHTLGWGAWAVLAVLVLALGMRRLWQRLHKRT